MLPVPLQRITLTTVAKKRGTRKASRRKRALKGSTTSARKKKTTKNTQKKRQIADASPDSPTRRDSNGSESGFDNIRRALDAVPFGSFEITFRNGAVYKVEHRQQIAVGLGTPATFMIASRENDFSLVSVEDIESVKRLPREVVLPEGWEGTTEPATSIDQLCEQISSLGDIGWYYRGESHFFPKRLASLGRYLSSNAPTPIEGECSEIKWFQKRAHSLLSPPERDIVRDDIVGWLTLMQHHHAPTRLLDWTYSPWVAAYHAASFDPEQSGFIWAFNPYSLVKKRPANWSEVESKLDTVTTVAEYRDILHSLPSKIVLSFHVIESTDRMIAQQGTFTFGHPPALDHANLIGQYTEKSQAKVLLIPNKLKRDLHQRMRSMNLTAASLFPGLDGVGKTTLETMRIGLAAP